MTAEDDVKLLDLGIGFTNIVERTTRGSANLSRKEIVGGEDAAAANSTAYTSDMLVYVLL